jgi:DNA-binding transcriptional LysR family regulator
MQMDLNRLKTFYTLAGTRSYTGCADKLCLTQSAVSHAIKKLETELGFDLVDRENRQFRLTRQGEFLYHQCTGIFDRIENAMDGLARRKDHPIFINLGVPVEFGSSVLIKGMGPFFLDRPHIHIDFTLDAQLLEPLLSDELDIIVDCVPHVHEDLVSVCLFREGYVVIATQDYIAQKDVCTIKDLNRCALLSFDKNLVWWKNFINAVSEDSGFGFEKIIRISNVRGIINAALTSLGVGFVPRYTVLRELENGSLKELFPETEVLNDQINIYLKKRNFKKQVFQDLISHIKSLHLN